MKRFLLIPFVAFVVLVVVGAYAQIAHANAPNATQGTALQEAIAGIGSDSPVSPRPDENWIFNNIMHKIVGLFAFLLGLSIVILDATVFYLVVRMGEFVGQLNAIGLTWQIMRDVGNIMLIFGFLAIGITTILNTEQFGYKKMLPKLLIAAVFLNFSLFISKAIIDTGNLFAAQIYTQINAGTPASGTVGWSSITNEGISNAIMGRLGLQKLYDARETPEVFFGSAPWYIGFLGIILFIVAAFVMFMLAFILIARFVILVFLMITSPVGFAGLAIPQLENHAKKWWDYLFTQTITAPVLLLMLYLALRVITDTGFLMGFGGADPDFTTYIVKGGENLTGFISIMLNFIVAIGLLLVVVVVSKQLSAFGGGFATKWAGRLSFGAVAYGASAPLNIAGRGGRAMLQRYAPNSRVARGITRFAARPLERIRMDVRRIPGVDKGLELAGAGEVAKPIERSAIGRVQQAKEWREKNRLGAEQAFQAETVIPRLNEEVRQSLQTGDYRRVSTILSSMSDKDLEKDAALRALIRNPIAAALLPQARFDKLQQSEAISDADKRALANARSRGDDPGEEQSRFDMDTRRRYPAGHQFAGMTRGEALIRRMNTSARGRLGGNILTERVNTAPPGTAPQYIHSPRGAVLDLLNGSDFDAIRRTGELAPADLVVVGNYIQNVINHTRQPGVTATPREASIVITAASPSFRAYYNLP